jgi:hypothetical protein
MTPEEILGEHPEPDRFGSHTEAEDTSTNSNVPHRVLIQNPDSRDDTIKQVREALIRHHVSELMLERDRRRREALLQLGYPISDNVIHRFPRSDKTQKGNFGEVFLAEYVTATAGAELPIYRLRYNPNVEQAMKGDDILAFDFRPERIRILVGESKFRSTPSKASVEEVVTGLIRSHQAGLPASLQFVADRLFEAGDIELAQRVENCSLLIVQGRLDLLYVGLLVSNKNVKSSVDRYTQDNLRNLVMISLGMDEPGVFVSDCFDGIEEQADVNTY